MKNAHRDMIVLQTHTSTPDFYGGCNCAAVHVTPRLVKLVRKRIDIAISVYRNDPMLWELCFSSPDLEFFDYGLVSACDDADTEFTNAFESAGKAHLPESIATADFEAARTECHEMVLRIISGAVQDVKTEVAWRVMPKHTETFVTTASLTIEELDAMLDPAKVQQQEA